MNNHDRSLDDIQSQIRRTRGRLDETLSAVEARLEPGQLMEHGVGYLRNHGVTEYFVSLGDAAKRQPLPLALVGAGLAWLMMSDHRDRVQSGNGRGGSSHSLSGTHADRGQTPSMVNGSTSHATSKFKATGNAAADTVADMRDTISHGAQQAASSISDTVAAAREHAEKLTGSARRGAQQVKSGYDHLMDEQPLALGAIGLAMGVLLAASAPRTRQEDRLMGGTSDRVKDEAKMVAREKFDQAKQVAVVAKDAAVEKAAEQASDGPSKPASDAPSASSSSTESNAPDTAAATASASEAATATDPTVHTTAQR